MQDMELWDWTRIFIGETPPIFMIEVLIRIFVIYLLLVVSMRGMGKRLSAMVSRNEMIALVSLAAAVGVPMQDPERGLLAPVIIAVVIIGVQRIISNNTMKSAKFESLVLGSIEALAKDGRLETKNMQETRVTRERLLTEFRMKEVTNLGKVQRAYMEANGSFTVYLFDEEEREGLCILPDWDKDFLQELTVTPEIYACGNCGNLVKNQKETEGTCAHCGEKQWSNAIRS